MKETPEEENNGCVVFIKYLHCKKAVELLDAPFKVYLSDVE
jgi:hypothetical protein